MGHHILLLSIMEAFFLFQIKSVKILSDLFDAEGRDAFFTELHVQHPCLATRASKKEGGGVGAKSRKSGKSLESSYLEARKRFLCRILTVAVEHLSWLEPGAVRNPSGRAGSYLKTEEEAEEGGQVKKKVCVMEMCDDIQSHSLSSKHRREVHSERGVKRKHDDDDESDAVQSIGNSVSVLWSGPRRAKRRKLSLRGFKQNLEKGFKVFHRSFMRNITKSFEQISGYSKTEPEPSSTPPSVFVPTQAENDGVASSSSSTITTTAPTFDVPAMGDSILDISVSSSDIRDWIGRVLGFSSSGVDAGVANHLGRHLGLDVDSLRCGMCTVGLRSCGPNCNGNLIPTDKVFNNIYWFSLQLTFY